MPELGTIKAQAHAARGPDLEQRPRAVATALKRRCLHLFIDFPAPADELEIIRLKVPEIPEQLARAVVAAVQKIRALDLRKPPSVSESLDWARSLVILNAQELDPALVESTLTMLVKYEKDLERVKGALDKVLAGAPPDARTMDERILEFIGDLRRAELRISTVGGARRAGRQRRGRARPIARPSRSTLAATLVKEARDHATFDRIFNLYFLDLEALGEGLKKALGPEDPQVQEHARPAARRGGPRPRRADRAAHARAGQRDGDGHPRGRPERRPRAADVLPAGRLLLAPHLRPVRLVGDRARPRADHADAGGRAASTPASSRASATTSSCAWRRSAA